MLVLGSLFTGYVSISAFASVVGIPLGIASFTVVLKICAIAAVIKEYKSLIAKKNKNPDIVVFLPKNKLNTSNRLEKIYFQYDMAYGDFNDLPKRTVLINYCMTKHLLLLKIRNMMDINEHLLDRATCTVRGLSYMR